MGLCTKSKLIVHMHTFLMDICLWSYTCIIPALCIKFYQVKVFWSSHPSLKEFFSFKLGVHVAEIGQTDNIWKRNASCGTWDSGAKKEDTKIQGVSMEICLLSFSWDFSASCNMQWTLVQKHKILLGWARKSILAWPEI